MGNKETRRYKEQAGPSGFGRSSKDKMDDMARIIKELSNNISRMELDQSKNDHFPRKYFKRIPNPQTQQRSIKNEDQKIQTPFKNENFIGGEDMQDFEELEEDISNLGDECQQPYLTRQDYEKSLNTEYRSENNKNNNITEDSTYQGITYDIMAELHQKYKIRPRNRNITTTPVKKIMPRGETDEAASKAAEKQTVKTKTVDAQSTKTKPVETSIINTRKAKDPVAETKTSPKNKTEKKGIEAQTIEFDKTT
jgi:hypothetical protein